MKLSKADKLLMEKLAKFAKNIARTLQLWEKTCSQLRIERSISYKRNDGHVREQRLERRVARLERSIVNMLYKETFGHVIGKPKFARSYARREVAARKAATKMKYLISHGSPGHAFPPGDYSARELYQEMEKQVSR